KDKDSGGTQNNLVKADCQTPGTCTANQHGFVDGIPYQNMQSGQDVSTSTNCTGSTCATPPTSGDVVYVSVGNGHIQVWNPNTTPPTLAQTLDTGKGPNPDGADTGLAFDAANNLFVTDWGASDVSKFAPDGTLTGSFGSGYNAHPESIVFDSSGNAYVGQADGSGSVLEFSPTGAPLNTFTPATEDRGTDWIDLGPDGCTLYYTSEGTSVKRFNVCTNTQLTNLATGLPGSAA